MCVNGTGHPARLIKVTYAVFPPAVFANHTEFAFPSPDLQR